MNRVLAAAVVLAACSTTTTPAPSSSSSTTGVNASSSTAPTTRPATTSTTVRSTTTNAPTTTRPLPPELVLAEPGAPPHILMFRVDVGPGGLTYEGGGPELPVTGPQALEPAANGDVWIADTEGFRLLRFDVEGTVIVDVSTDDSAVGPLIDLAADAEGVWGLEVVPALERYRLLHFDDAGMLDRSLDLPATARLESGLSGIVSDPSGQLWVELEGGARLLRVFGDDGEVAFTPSMAYTVDGVAYRTLAVRDGEARFSIGDTFVTRPVRQLGGLVAEGFMSGAIVLSLADVGSGPGGSLDVDLTLLVADASGRVMATADYPLDDIADVYVPQDYIAATADGRVIAMIPRRAAVEIVELALFAP